MSEELVVVGAGSAGSVIAARVTESGQRSVLLIEAGPDYPDPSRLPRELANGGRNAMAAHDWGYRHRPTSGQLNFRFPRGRVVGGSSAVNTCIALRGQPADYDEWAERGLSEWSWERCLPAFKRLERDLDMHDDFHGQDGPLPIRRHPAEELCVWQAAFLEACAELRFPACADSNAPNSHGFGPHAMNKLDGRRISAAEAFLGPSVRARSGFSLRPDTLVRRVLLRNRRVVGVEVEGRAGVETIATERVVLCAGAINTPGILLRSGIGPRAEVERLGCELVTDVPAVGRRLLDHPGTAIFLRPRFGSRTSRQDPLIQTVLRYGSEGSGHPSDMLLQPGSKVNLTRVDLPLVSLMCAVGRPRQHGVLRFPSASPHARPVIESRLLEDAHDRGLAVDAMLLAYRLAQTKPLRGLAAHFWPSQRVLRDRTRTDAWIRSACDSGYHPCGTVPMGRENDLDAAADAHGRVRGVEGLFVADASLMPTIPSSNIHLAVLMIGERFGQLLRDGTLS
ncbi:MAG: GMC family oxidoreductase [Polyangiales bacterium]